MCTVNLTLSRSLSESLMSTMREVSVRSTVSDRPCRATARYIKSNTRWHVTLTDNYLIPAFRQRMRSFYVLQPHSQRFLSADCLPSRWWSGSPEKMSPNSVVSMSCIIIIINQMFIVAPSRSTAQGHLRQSGLIVCLITQVYSTTQDKATLGWAVHTIKTFSFIL